MGLVAGDVLEIGDFLSAVVGIDTGMVLGALVEAAVHTVLHALSAVVLVNDWVPLAATECGVAVL